MESAPQFDDTARPADQPKGWIERIFVGAVDILNSIGTIWIFVLMFLIVADVIARSGFNRPIDGVTDIAAFSIIGIVFLQIGATVHTGRMTKGDVLLEILARRSKGAAAVVETLFLAVGALMFALIIRASWPLLVRSLARSEFFGVEGVFTFPTWPIRLIIVVGAAATVIAYLIQITKVLKNGFGSAR